MIDELIRLLQMGAKPTVWLRYGAGHEEVPFVKVWLDGLTLRAEVTNATPGADAIEFRENQQTVWKVSVNTGKRRAFTFEQKIVIGKPKLGWLRG
jgi:hypothetical protein